MKKNDWFESRSGKSYKIAGKWCGDIVLSPVDDNDDECLIYTSGEMEEFIGSGYFKPIGGGQ